MLNVALCLSIKSSGGVKKFDTVTPPQIATQQEKVFFGGGSLFIDCHVSVTAKLMCGLTNILSSYFPSHPVVCLWIIVLNFQAICKIGKQCIVKDLITLRVRVNKLTVSQETYSLFF